MYADVEFQHITVSFTVASVLVCGLIAVTLQLCRRRRRWNKRDGLLALGGMPRRARISFTFATLAVLVLPTLVYAVCIVFGAILSLGENWSFATGLRYAVPNVVGMNPLVQVTPASNAGTAMDIIASLAAFMTAQAVIGIAASACLADALVSKAPRGVLSFALVVLVLAPAFLVAVCWGLGFALATVEQWSTWEGFLAVIGIMCGIGDPLTSVTPRRPHGQFFVSWCYVVQLLMSGLVVSFVIGHPFVGKLLRLLEGDGSESDTQRSSRVSGARAPEAEGAVGEPGRAAQEPTRCKGGSFDDERDGSLSKEGSWPTTEAGSQDGVSVQELRRLCEENFCLKQELERYRNARLEQGLELLQSHEAELRPFV